MTKRLILSSLLVLLAACAKENKLTVLFDNTDGMEAGIPVKLNNYKIGTVDHIGLNKDFTVCFDLYLDQWLKIPRDSRFQLDAFLSEIQVVPGKSKKYLSPADTIQGVHLNSFSLDSLLDVAADAINNSKPVRNQDTLVSSVRELNKKLDKLDKQLQNQKR